MSHPIRFDRDDPRLTAYALGELAPEERAAVEALLERDPEARRFVAELKSAGEALAAGFAAEKAPGLTEAQRRRIMARRGVKRFGIAWRVAAAAAVVAVVAGGIWITQFWRGSWYVAGRVESAESLTAHYDERELDQVGYIAADPSAESPVPSTEAYDAVPENEFRLAEREPLSTFSTDVDTASYSNMRRFLREGRLPPPSSVRIEEFVNYFRYDDQAPEGDQPFSVSTESAACPWRPEHLLVRVALKGREIDMSQRKPANLVFLVDVSGSMDMPDKLPLLVRSMRLLVEQLDEKDRVSVVVYAGASGLVLPPTSGADRWIILAALDGLQAGGSTNGGAGIELAYRLAQESFIAGGLNRVILATDGDFNVGVTDQGSLVDLIEEKRESGVFLTVLGYGTGNLKDSTMEKLADHGNGQYAYIDSLAEARRVLVEQMGGTLMPIAKDVKIQVEFNPREVEAWRLIGYENRLLAHQDFNDDTKDAGEIGAGGSVTALYEVVPKGVAFDVPPTDDLRYSQPAPLSGSAFCAELMFVKVRHKDPDGTESRLITMPVPNERRSFGEASADFRFAASVAAFAALLRQSRHVEGMTMPAVLEMAAGATGEDPGGYRREFLELVNAAIAIGSPGESAH